MGLLGETCYIYTLYCQDMSGLGLLLCQDVIVLHILFLLFQVCQDLPCSGIMWL
jgi:hypothetical protein